MTQSMFRKATKELARARVAISGSAGSGKTMWSLQWATVLADGAPIAVIDTERGSASLYADRFAFDVLQMAPPYHPDRLVKALKEAEQAGYAVVVIDSLTHFWSGQGGVLELVDEAATRFKGNTHAAWQVGTPIQQRMVDALIGHGGHVIATMRAKTEWVMETGPNGKVAPRKVGLAPQQRSDIEFEFTLFMELEANSHRATPTKTRFGAFAGKVFEPNESEDAARQFAAWLNAGDQPTAPAAPTPTPKEETRADVLKAEIARLDDSQRKRLRELWDAAGLPKIAEMDAERMQVAEDLLISVQMESDRLEAFDV